MKRENRQYEIRSATWDEVEGKQYYTLPLLIEYKGQKQILPCGQADSIDVMRDGNDMYLLSTNYNLDYAGLTLIDFEEVETGTFMEAVSEQFDSKTKFFEYSPNYQADILVKYLDY